MIGGARLALPAPPGSVPLNWRKVLGEPPSGLSASETKLVVENRYRRAAMEKRGDESALLELNLAIEQAREEIGA